MTTHSALLIIVSSSAIWSCQTPQATIAPQAVPVFNLFKAIKTGDIDLLKSVFSATVYKELDRTDWKDNLRLYRAEMKKQFGVIRLDELRFEYKGKGEFGQVFVIQNQKKHDVPLNVILEKNVWKLDEE